MKNIWVYLLGAALLAGALATPPKLLADGSGGANCPKGQMCKP